MKIKPFLKNVVVLTLIALVAGSVGAVIFSSSTVTAQVPQVIDTTPQKVESLKEEVINSIEDCETPNLAADDAPLILDTNNQMSIGKLMFQIKTIQEYEKSLYNKEITRKDAVEIALDASSSEALAKDIIFKKEGINNWYNCNKKLGLDAKIAVINELE